MNFAAAGGPVTPADSKHLHLQVSYEAAPPERKCIAQRQGTLAEKEKGSVRSLPAKPLPSRPHFQARGRASARAVA